MVFIDYTKVGCDLNGAIRIREKRHKDKLMRNRE